MVTLKQYFDEISNLEKLKLELVALGFKHQEETRTITSKIEKTQRSADKILQELRYKNCEESSGGHDFQIEYPSYGEIGIDKETIICQKCRMVK